MNLSNLALRRLNQTYNTSKYIPFDSHSRIIIMSDCHRGLGNWGDNFAHNQNIYFAALSFYYENGYTYIELGDGDELWENRSYASIIDTYDNIFWLLSQFNYKNRLYMLYGNHDIVKKDFKYIDKIHSFCTDTCIDNDITLFSDIEFYNGLILYNGKEKQKIFLTHGHQADLFNDVFWKLSRFLVRYIWRPLELIGVKNPTSAATAMSTRSKVERNLIKWVEENGQMMIVGHTHRPVFPKEGDSLYFNDGSCVHPRCITGIEICNGSISLIKWSVLVDSKQNLYVGRTLLEGPTPLSEFL